MTGCNFLLNVLQDLVYVMCTCPLDIIRSSLTLGKVARDLINPIKWPHNIHSIAGELDLNLHVAQSVHAAALPPQDHCESKAALIL